MSNMLLTVLSDGETFGGADGSAILIGPSEDKITEEQLDDFNDGRLPMSVLEAWALVEVKLTNEGDLVAWVSGLGDGERVIQLASREQLARVS